MIDRQTWQQISALLDYWKEFPPVHILLQGIAAGLGAKFGSSAIKAPEKKHVESGEELLGILQGSGISFGVIPSGR